LSSSRFRLPSQKMEVARLGLPYAHPMSPVDGSVLHLVSCSAVIELKRIHLIAEILSHITVPVKWTHFGDGPLMNEVKQKVGSLKLSKFCEFKGYVPNGEFLSYLQSTAISLVINVSESEGIPVSLMEAISFGIPVAGPDVCGVPELVTKDTGLL